MNLELQNYLQILSNKNNSNKGNMITNIGLLLEKNNGYTNPTDYSLLLPKELKNLSINTEDKEKVIDCLLSILKHEPIYSSRIVWSIGKTFDEKIIESLLSSIIQSNQCDDETFEQILFIVDVIQNEQINNFVQKIKSLRMGKKSRL
ncbi:MAG: hypothetical protein K6G00_09600 [Treponema sp.]|nr:hypothetical protein [Treponema sp.]